MSAMAAVVDGQQMSWSEYVALGDDVRSEYLDGRVVMTPLPTQVHQQICFQMATLLMHVDPHSTATIGWGWKPADDEFGPDVMVHPKTEESLRFTGMPLLVVEVLSSNRSHDLVRKSTKYAALGLTDYWIVDPRDHAIETFVLRDGAYESSGRFERGCVELAFGDHRVEVDVDALLG